VAGRQPAGRAEFPPAVLGGEGEGALTAAVVAARRHFLYDFLGLCICFGIPALAAESCVWPITVLMPSCAAYFRHGAVCERRCPPCFSCSG
jgi:hypothetical protein